MAESHPLDKCSATSEHEDENQKSSRQAVFQQYRDHISSLPSVDGFIGRPSGKLYLYNDWYATMPMLVGVMAANQFFKPKPSDIVLVTFPKSGTTWLKALLFACINRHLDYSALSDHTPHQIIPFLDMLYAEDILGNLDSLPSPRLFSSHTPFKSLPDSVSGSGCRIIYLFRSPKDIFVSLWHFVNKVREKQGAEPLPLEVSFNRFCNGHVPFGPLWDHVLGYWKASLEGEKNRFLFMRYEELMGDPVTELKRLANFVRRPFTLDEEKEGAVERIVKHCGFENLSSLEVNKTGTTHLLHLPMDNSTFFRRGKVGDWVNHLTPEMAQRLDMIVEAKFRGSGMAL